MIGDELRRRGVGQVLLSKLLELAQAFLMLLVIHFIV